MALHAKTALRILYDELVMHGYCDTQVEFADLLRINRKTINQYLTPPNRTRRVSPRLDTLLCWGWAVSQQTNLEVGLTVDSCGEVLWQISGWTSAGKPLPAMSLQTNFREIDARPTPSWEPEWAKFLNGSPLRLRKKRRRKRVTVIVQDRDTPFPAERRS